MVARRAAPSREVRVIDIVTLRAAPPAARGGARGPGRELVVCSVSDVRVRDRGCQAWEVSCWPDVGVLRVHAPEYAPG